MHGSGRSKVCVPIIGKTLDEALKQLDEARGEADLYELRMDFLAPMGRQAIDKIIREIDKPWILCLRKQGEGGHFTGSEEERLKALIAFKDSTPDFIDIEHSADETFFDAAQKHFPSSNLIISYHNHERTEEDLPALLSRMKGRQAAFYKIATWAHSSLDGMRMLNFLKDNPETKLIGISMGPCGEFTRVLAPLAGSEVVYAAPSLASASAPGQIPLHDMVNTYRVKKLTPKTKALGLIGDPVTKSPSDRTHNRVIEEIGLDAVYVKIPVKADELTLFIRAAKQFGFTGLSVTMPLKELLFASADSLQGDAKIAGAVNTLRFAGADAIGYNTDGKGALDALEESMQVKGKKLLIVGAGGSAKAIASEAVRRGASILCVNRTESKAVQLAESSGGKGYSFEAFRQVRPGYDALIHCTPMGMFGDSAEEVESLIEDNTLVMDIVVSNEETGLMKKARSRGCAVIGGYAMLKKQAVSQFKIWTDREGDAGFIERAFDRAFHPLMPVFALTN